MAALVCGLCGLVIAGVILGIVAIVLGVRARGELLADPGHQDGDGLATAGIVLGIIDIITGTLLAILVLS